MQKVCEKVNVLFVCHGHICRSASAEEGNPMYPPARASSEFMKGVLKVPLEHVYNLIDGGCERFAEDFVKECGMDEVR